MEKEDIIHLLEELKQIEQVAEGLEYLNSLKIDFPCYNFIAKFSERNKNLIHTIIVILSNNMESHKDFDNEYNTDTEGSKLLIIFALRDIIENIEVLSWLKLNNSFSTSIYSDNTLIKDEISFSEFIDDFINNINSEKYIHFSNKIVGKEKMKSYKISRSSKNNLEYNLEKTFGEINLSEEFKYLENLKNILHNYIHKNGINYINLDTISYIEFINQYCNKIKFVFKFYFKICFLLDSTCICSSDYIDFLENGVTPPINCQYWIAPIFNDYISNQFDEKDKKWLKSKNNSSLEFDF